MRLKALSLQMAPWCFAAATARRPPSSDADSDSSSDDEKLPIRVVAADGAVRVYEAPVSAAEVMAAHPCHLVCRADAAFTIGQKVPALSAADSLLPGHSYFLLPSHFFHSVLSFVSLASSLLLAGSTTAAASKVRPFRISKSPAGALQIVVVCDQLINSDKNTTIQVKKDAKERSSGRRRVCTDEGLQKEYREMVEARRERRWTPKLETIGECERRRRWWW